MSIALFALSALMIVGDPDGVVTTAPDTDRSILVGAIAPVAPELPQVSEQTITPHGLSTDEQIDRWIQSRAEASQPFSEDDTYAVVDDRKMHGEVSAAIGTNDYRAWSAAVSIPFGETGRIDLSYSETKNGYGLYGYGHGPHGFGYPAYGYAHGYPFYGAGRSDRPFGTSSRTIRTRVFEQGTTAKTADED